MENLVRRSQNSGHRIDEAALNTEPPSLILMQAIEY
jgi:hypothetical protein